MVLLERNLYGHPLAASSGKDNLRKFYWDQDGEKYRTGNVHECVENKDYSYRYTWMILKCVEEKQNMSPMWKKLMKNVDLGEPTSFVDHENLGCTQRECKPNETAIDEYRKMFESRISAAASEK